MGGAGRCGGFYVNGRGRDRPHGRRAWRAAGQPELQAWAAALPAVHVREPPASCRIGFCGRWAQGEAGLCWSHVLRWRQLGRPDLAGFIRGYDSDWVPMHEQDAAIARALQEDEAHRQADLKEVAEKEAEAVPDWPPDPPAGRGSG